MGRYASKCKLFTKNVEDFIIKPLILQRESGLLCDVKIHINTQTFSIHRAIVSLWSPYFRSMFTCDMKEKFSETVDLTKSLTLHNDTVFQTVLDYMYTGSIALTPDNVQDVLQIADFLLMDDLKSFCSKFFLEYNYLKLSNCLSVLFMSDKYHLEDVRARAYLMLKSRFHDYTIFQEEMLSLPPSLFVQLLTDIEVIQHASLDNLRYLMYRWLENRQQTQSNVYNELEQQITNSLILLNEAVDADGKLKQPCQNQYYNHVYWKAVLNAPPLYYSSVTFLHPATTVNHAQSYRDVSRILLQSQSDSEQEHNGIFALQCNNSSEIFKLLIYVTSRQQWFRYPLSIGALANLISRNHRIYNAIIHDNCIYMYLAPHQQFPTDMFEMNIVMLDLLTRQINVFCFKTSERYHSSYKTTDTRNPSIPPALLLCNNNIYVIGNKDGIGHLFECNVSNHQFNTHQIPNARFISLVRAVVIKERFVYVWYRHHTGLSEEVSMNKEVGFSIFDSKTKTFSASTIHSPNIDYDSFSSNYILAVRDDTIVIYILGQNTLILDESSNSWIVSFRRIPTVLSNSALLSRPTAYQLFATTSDSMLVFHYNARHTTFLYEIIDSLPHPVSLTPPPTDRISTLFYGSIATPVYECLARAEEYDGDMETAQECSDADSFPLSDDSLISSSSLSIDDDNEYVYDDDIFFYE